MDPETLVKYMMKIARKDLFNGKGRIVINDFHKELPSNENPTPIEMLQAWRKWHPDIPISWRMNTLIIDLSGWDSYGEFEVVDRKVEDHAR